MKPSTTSPEAVRPGIEGLPSPARRRGRVMIWLGVVCGAIVLLGVIVGPWIVGQDPLATDADALRQGPSAAHWLGTDDLGRDLAARLAAGGRTDLIIAVLAVVVTTVLAVAVGVWTGYFGGVADLVVTRIIDAIHAVPGLLISLGIIAVMGRSAVALVVAVAVAFWMGYARLMRAEVVNIRSQPYIDAAKVLGVPAWRIIWKDVLPALRPMILVNSTAVVGGAILSAAGLGFLGLGIQAPAPSWGAMLAESRQFLYTRPEIGIMASIPIVLTVIAVNVLSDELQVRLSKGRNGQ